MKAISLSRKEKELRAAPNWLQELIESHESLPWQRRGYLREALLDQLTLKAGYVPLEEAQPSRTAAAAEDEQDSVPSLRSFDVIFSLFLFS